MSRSKNTTKVGIDFDGCFSENPEFFNSIQGKKFIVSGRPKSDSALLDRLIPRGYKILVYPNEWPQGMGAETDKVVAELQKIAEWKAEMIKKNKIKAVFEDDYRMLKVIKQKNPNCICFLVL